MQTSIVVGIVSREADGVRSDIEDALKDAHMVATRPKSPEEAKTLDALVIVLDRERLELGAEWTALAPMPIIAVASEIDPEAAFALLEAGARDVVFAPVRAAELIARLWRACGRHGASCDFDSNARLTMRAVFGDCPNLICALAHLPKIAQSKAAVLISGETGTGKELCARAVHYLSARKDGPFVAVNCGALPASIAENELFGHERGAYTNAETRQVGLVEEANGGTMFLDELDSLIPAVQAKLLRFLQDREYRRLGSARARHVDVRIVAATNANLQEAVGDHRLREDLYYRLRTFELHIPPLRDRPDDIERLARLFLARCADEHGRPPPRLARNAVAALLSYAWPGNVRELQQVIERAVVLADSNVVDASLLNLEVPEARGGVRSFREAKAEVVDHFERQYLTGLLRAYRGNITRAASAAQKNRRAFFELLKKHDIDPSAFRAGVIGSLDG